MKNVSLIVNAVLFVAVAVLYFLHFTGNSNQEAKSTGIAGNISIEDMSVAYINFDTIPQLYLI